MKKMYFALLMLGLVLTSCGGTAYTTDKDEALELAQEILDEEKEAYKEYLDYAKEVKEKKDKILKEYSGKESKLMKKAKKGDEDALSALKELRNLDINSEEKYEDIGKSLQKKQRAYNLSISDIRALNDADDLEDWEKDLAKIEKKRNKARDDYFEDYEELMKDDDDDEEEDYNEDYSYEDDY
jgi:hypothetical protein